MKPILSTALPCSIALLGLALAGCGSALARPDRPGRTQAVILTDANALSGPTRGNAVPPAQITDPDRIAAVEGFLESRRDRWQKVKGTPRAMRFQLQLVGDGKPLYTVWFEPGYAQGTGGGKDLREMRLSNADMAELLNALGMPPEYQAVVANAKTIDYGPPHSGVVKEPTIMPTGGMKKKR